MNPSDKSLVSVVIPTYNRSRLLRETLESVFVQTYPAVEVIVVNDGSRDDTAEVMAPLASDGRIRYLEQANGGLGRARNLGMSVARGDYVSFLDDDDLIPPDKIGWQARYLDEHPDAGIIGGSHQILGQPAPAGHSGEVDRDCSFADIIRCNPFVSAGQILLRSTMVRKLGGFDERVVGVQDWDMWIRASEITRVVKRNHVSLLYRLHASSMSSNSGMMLRECTTLIRSHLGALEPVQRTEVWTAARRNIYDGLGSKLVSNARHATGRLRLLTAARLLAGLRPLAGFIVTDPETRNGFVRDLLGRAE